MIKIWEFIFWFFKNNVHGSNNEILYKVEYLIFRSFIFMIEKKMNNLNSSPSYVNHKSKLHIRSLKTFFQYFFPQNLWLYSHKIQLFIVHKIKITQKIQIYKFTIYAPETLYLSLPKLLYEIRLGTYYLFEYIYQIWVIWGFLNLPKILIILYNMTSKII